KLDALTKRLQAEQRRRLSENKLAYYQPYPKQIEFHNAGATYRERLLCAGNQLGKTTAGGFELAMHVTGRYPDWWGNGKRFDRPITAWACGTTGETTRDTVQRILVGRPDARGTGSNPQGMLGRTRSGSWRCRSPRHHQGQTHQRRDLDNRS